MAIEIKVPDIGADEVEITEILVKVGDKVEAEQSLITVEGDKASMEVPSPQAGVVKEIKVSVGDKTETGKLIMIFDSAEGAAAAAPAQEEKKEAAPAAAAPAAAAAAKEVHVPDIGGDEVEVTEIMVKVGDTIAAEQSLITVEGDKASMEVPAPFAGTVKEIKISTGDKVKTGSLIMVFEVEGAAPAAAPAQAAAPAPAAAPAQAAKPAAAPAAKAEGKSEFAENDAYVHATPLIRRLAREFGVNLAKVKGTGRKGRILREDVQAYVKDAVKRAESAPAAAAGGGIPGMLPWPKVDFSKFGEVEEVELGRIQKISGANLSRNWVMIPHVTHFDKTDITDLEAFASSRMPKPEA
ncbi:MAG: biotin/lipoyl-containing protein [Klebsiella pneumoniae]